MEVNQFIENFRQAFGENQVLPIAIWYSEVPISSTPKVGGCYFKCLREMSNELAFTIPMSRFKVMYNTMRQSCLFDTHGWAKILERINT